jgi:hypothetical protein
MTPWRVRSVVETCREQLPADDSSWGPRVHIDLSSLDESVVEVFAGEAVQ